MPARSRNLSRRTNESLPYLAAPASSKRVLDGALGTAAQARRAAPEGSGPPQFGKPLSGDWRFDARARRGARWPTWGGAARQTDVRSRASGLGTPRNHHTKGIDERMLVGSGRAA